MAITRAKVTKPTSSKPKPKKPIRKAHVDPKYVEHCSSPSTASSTDDPSDTDDHDVVHKLIEFSSNGLDKKSSRKSQASEKKKAAKTTICKVPQHKSVVNFSTTLTLGDLKDTVMASKCNQCDNVTYHELLKMVSNPRNHPRRSITLFS